MIKKVRFLGAEGYELANERLACVVLPEFGGKIASIKYRKNNFELLFQNPKKQFSKAYLGADFSSYEACGFDDAFPSIDKGEVLIGGSRVAYPDHGEIWSASFDSRVEEESLHMVYRSTFLPCRYEKRLFLEEKKLVAEYEICNVGNRAFPYLWACHCLVNYSPDMKICFPAGTKAMEMVLDSERFGKAGIIRPYGGDWDFSSVPAEKNRMEKYYVQGSVEEGKCGYVYPSQGMEAKIEFDADKLPYLGFWVTSGAYRGDQNCALEPASGYYDSIEKAMAHRACSVLEPGEDVNFYIAIGLHTIQK